jgi:hypothetical protein
MSDPDRDNEDCQDDDGWVIPGLIPFADGMADDYPED